MKGQPPDDGLYIVSTYEEIRSLLFHPKVSSQGSRLKFPRTGNLFTDWIINPIKARIAHKYRPLVFRDPPEHDGLRRHIMLQFTPERMQRMKGRVTAIIDELIAGMQGRRQIDLVEAFSYPPVSCDGPCAARSTRKRPAKLNEAVEALTCGAKAAMLRSSGLWIWRTDRVTDIDHPPSRCAS
jgi:hypothetical protein